MTDQSAPRTSPHHHSVAPEQPSRPPSQAPTARPPRGIPSPQSGRQQASSVKSISSLSGSETVSVSGARSRSTRAANSGPTTSGSGRSSTIHPSPNHQQTQQSSPSILQTPITLGQQPADHYQRNDAPLSGHTLPTQPSAGPGFQAQTPQFMPPTASARPGQAVPSHINATNGNRQDGRSRPPSEIAPGSSISQQPSRQSRRSASQQGPRIAPKAPSQAKSVRGEAEGHYKPHETFQDAGPSRVNAPLQPQAHNPNDHPLEEAGLQGGVRPPLRPGLMQGAAEDYYNPGQTFSTAVPSRVGALPQPFAPMPEEQTPGEGAERPSDRRRNRHRHRLRRPIIQEDHDYFIARSSFQSGTRGYLYGMFHLLLGKSHVREHTAERLDLLSRAHKYFNSGVISSVPGFKEKKGRFEEEMRVVTETLLHQERERSKANCTGDHRDHEHDRFVRCKAGSSETLYRPMSR